ncbi:MAG: hypothetical protein IT211_08450 [Armatimonadetes bacterium]|nr:hypothetical protein [Armatimonadota bacterium]
MKFKALLLPALVALALVSCGKKADAPAADTTAAPAATTPAAPAATTPAAPATGDSAAKPADTAKH